MRPLAAVLSLFFPVACPAVSFIVPQVVDGTTWKTTITVFARSFRGAQVTISFLDDNGKALPLPIVGVGTVASTQFVLGSFDSLTLETESTSSTLQAGWAQIEASDEIGGLAVFRQRIAGQPDFEAAVPFTVPQARLISSFDNLNGFATGIAIVNNTGGPITVVLGFREEGGLDLGTRVVVLNDRAHTSFALADRFPETAGKRGSVYLMAQTGTSVEGAMSVLGLRFSPRGPFTTLPYFVSIMR